MGGESFQHIIQREMPLLARQPDQFTHFLRQGGLWRRQLRTDSVTVPGSGLGTGKTQLGNRRNGAIRAVLDSPRGTLAAPALRGGTYLLGLATASAFSGRHITFRRTQGACSQATTRSGLSALSNTTFGRIAKKKLPKKSETQALPGCTLARGDGTPPLAWHGFSDALRRSTDLVVRPGGIELPHLVAEQRLDQRLITVFRPLALKLAAKLFDFPRCRIGRRY